RGVGGSRGRAASGERREAGRCGHSRQRRALPLDLALRGRDMSTGKSPVVDRVALSPIVEALCVGAREFAQFPGGRIVLPSRDAVGRVVEDLRSIFFPGYFGTSDLDHEGLEYFVGAALARAMRHLEEEIRRGVAFTERHDYETCAHCGEFAARTTRIFLSRVPAIRDLAHSDIDAAYEGDPALHHRDEAVFAYPG